MNREKHIKYSRYSVILRSAKWYLLFFRHNDVGRDKTAAFPTPGDRTVRNVCTVSEDRDWQIL